MAHPLRLVMIRHGESEANVVQKAQKYGKKSSIEDLVNNRADWKQRLSPLGKEQAQKAALELKKIYGSLNFFDKHYTSPFIRARETAWNISRFSNIRWYIDDRLSERIWGIYGLVPRKKLKEEFPLTTKLANNDPWYIRLDGGESLFDVYNRVKDFREKMWRADSGENVLIVAHKQLIQSFCYDIEKKLPEDWDNIWQNKIYDISNLGLVEYSRVNPLDAKDVRSYYSWRRMINLSNRDTSKEEWVEFDPDKSFLCDEIARQVDNYRPFMN